jgi:hypothetical protein
MFYSTKDRFPTATTKKSPSQDLNNISIEPYKVDTPITNVEFAKPFKQIEKILQAVHISGDNIRR